VTNQDLSANSSPSSEGARDSSVKNTSEVRPQMTEAEIRHNTGICVADLDRVIMVNSMQLNNARNR
jgi:hypothetical protein